MILVISAVLYLETTCKAILKAFTLCRVQGIVYIM